MKDLKFDFTIEETNLILEALGDMPFNKVFGLINKIQQQAASQLDGANMNGEASHSASNVPQIDNPQ